MTKEDILLAISNHSNTHTDSLCLESIMAAAKINKEHEIAVEKLNETIDIEVSKQFLSRLRTTEFSITCPSLFSIYYAELAKAYRAIGNLREAYSASYDALVANQFVNDKEGCFIALGLLAEFSYMMGHYEQAKLWIEDRKQSPVYADMYSMDELLDTPPSQLLYQPLPEHKPNQLLSKLTTDDDSKYIEIATRRLRRSRRFVNNEDISLKKSAKIIKGVSIEELKDTIGDYPFHSVKARFLDEKLAEV